MSKIKFRKLEFWAKDGLIHLLDTDCGEEKTIVPEEFMQRARAVVVSACEKWPSDIREAVNFADSAKELFKEAKEQQVKLFGKEIPYNIPRRPIFAGVRYTIETDTPTNIMKKGYKIRVL